MKLINMSFLIIKVLRMRKANEEVEERFEAMKKENRMFASELIFKQFKIST